ncbi:MAG: GrpB family protein [Rubrivivax sp.]|nr:GrpB family protein [Rubrivivax sp.]
MGFPTTEDGQITILPHSADWAALFATEAKVLRAALDPWLVAEIEHVGSTAVTGLSAKPVIDIMAPVRDLESSREAIAAAESVGYCYYPYKPDEMHWFCKPSPEVRTHHLHLIPWSSPLWNDRLAFREALRETSALAQQYETLKLELAARYPNDREAYTQAKGPFIASVLSARRARVASAA